MEDDHRLLEWKMTGFLKTGRQPQIFLSMEDNLEYVFKYLCAGKTTSNIFGLNTMHRIQCIGYNA
jgi:hypothetical protein